MNKTGIAIVISILFGFCLVIWATDAVGVSFGKFGENIALGLVAVFLIIGLMKAGREKK